MTRATRDRIEKLERDVRYLLRARASDFDARIRRETRVSSVQMDLFRLCDALGYEFVVEPAVPPVRKIVKSRRKKGKTNG